MDFKKYNNYHDKFRQSSVDFLNKEITDINISRKIEKSIYNYCIRIARDGNIKRKWDNLIFKNLYISKLRSIYSNISDCYIQNKNFKNKIITNQVDVENIANLSSYDIFPENWKDLIDEKMKKDKLKYELKPEAMTDVFKCRKCNSRSCSYYEVQTRSADEPMTQFINCLDCGNRWRQ
jgi:transcription elongation factor S-II